MLDLITEVPAMHAKIHERNRKTVLKIPKFGEIVTFGEQSLQMFFISLQH